MEVARGGRRKGSINLFALYTIFIVSFVASSFLPPVAGVCSAGPVSLSAPAGYFGSDGSVEVPDPPPSGILGQFPTANPLGALPASHSCIWIIQNNNTDTVYLNFYTLNLAPGDNLYIYDGNTTSPFGALLATYTSTTPKSQFSYVTGAVTIQFVTSSSSNGTGFGLYYQAGACMYGIQRFTDLIGSLDDGSGDNFYAPQQLCGFIIEAPTPNSFVRLSLYGLVEAGFDYVTIYDGPDDTARRIGITGTYFQNFSVDSSGPNAYVTFFTDKRTQYYGFQIQYEIFSNQTCSSDSTYTDVMGQFSDGSGEGDYQPNSDCGFIIESAVNSIEIFYSEFHLGSGDSLSIYRGRDATGELLAVHTGSRIPAHESWEGDAIYFHFTSDGSNEGPGFVITYHAGSCFVTAEIHGDAFGVINDGSGNSTYAPFLDCLWFFDFSQVDGIIGIAYNFTMYDIEYQYDTLTLYDGPTITSPTLFQASGFAPPGTYHGVTSGRYMLIRFVTDIDGTSVGWEMTYKTAYPSDSSDDTALIVGLSVGLGGSLFLCILFLLLLVILILLFWRRRAPLKLELKEPDYVALTWNIPIVEDPGFNYQDHTKRLRVLEKFLLNSVVVEAVSATVALSPEEISEISYAMLLIHQTNDQSIKMLRTLLVKEIVKTGEGDVPLREDSMATMAFKMFAHLVGLPFLWEIFAFPIAELEMRKESEDLHKKRHSMSVESMRSSGQMSPHRKSSKAKGTEMSLFSISSTLEMNPDKLEEGQDKKVNQLQLQLLLQKLFVKLINSVEIFPPALRYLLYKIHSDLESTHPNLLHLVMGNLVFLRFLCPALIMPQKYGVTKNTPHTSTQRTLILITKVLQNLSNKVQFGNKEPYMLPMNKFINDNIEKVEGFFDELGSPAVKPLFGDPPSSIVPNNYRKNAMVTMYTYVIEHADALEMKIKEILPDKQQNQKIIRALLYLKGLESDAATPYSTTGSHLTTRSSRSDEESDVIWLGDKK